MKKTFLIKEVDERHWQTLKASAQARGMKMGDMLGKMVEVHDYTVHHPNKSGEEILKANGVEAVTR
jgi:hypothetical protein